MRSSPTVDPQDTGTVTFEPAGVESVHVTTPPDSTPLTVNDGLLVISTAPDSSEFVPFACTMTLVVVAT